LLIYYCYFIESIYAGLLNKIMLDIKQMQAIGIWLPMEILQIAKSVQERNLTDTG